MHHYYYDLYVFVKTCAVSIIACVASVSVRFSARSRHFSFFSRAKIGASAKKSPVTHFFALAPIFARLKNEKCLERAENLTETLATQAVAINIITPQVAKA